MARKYPHRRRSFRRIQHQHVTRGRRLPPPREPIRLCPDDTAAVRPDESTALHADDTATTPAGDTAITPDDTATTLPAETVPPQATGPAPAARRPADAAATNDPHIAALLSEISELRLSAATHLTVAAAAMDAGRPDIAAELIEAQQRDVARLRLRAEELLRVEGSTAEQARRDVVSAAALEESVLLQNARTPATKSLRRSPRGAAVAVLPRRATTQRASQWSATGVLLAVAAAVVVAVMRPLAPHTAAPDPQQMSASVVASLDANVTRSYDELRAAALPTAQVGDVEQAAAQLHKDLRRLVPMAADDPAAAQHVLQVLQAERSLLASHAPAGLASFNAEATGILISLRAQATPAVLAILPGIEEIIAPPDFASAARPAAAPQPKSAPAPAASTAGGSGAQGGAHSTGQGSSAGGGTPAGPAPVVVLPDPPKPVPVGGGSDGGSSTGGSPVTGGGVGTTGGDSGATGTGPSGTGSTGTGTDTGAGTGTTTGTGTGSGTTGQPDPGLNLPLPQPLPEVLNQSTN